MLRILLELGIMHSLALHEQLFLFLRPLCSPLAAHCTYIKCKGWVQPKKTDKPQQKFLFSLHGSNFIVLLTFFSPFVKLKRKGKKKGRHYFIFQYSYHSHLSFSSFVSSSFSSFRFISFLIQIRHYIVSL